MDRRLSERSSDNSREFFDDIGHEQEWLRNSGESVWMLFSFSDNKGLWLWLLSMSSKSSSSTRFISLSSADDPSDLLSSSSSPV